MREAEKPFHRRTTSPPLSAKAQANGGKTLESRTYQRNDLMQIVQYNPSAETSDTVLKGVIKNYSSSGICLIARQLLSRRRKLLSIALSSPHQRELPLDGNKILIWVHTKSVWSSADNPFSSATKLSSSLVPREL